jgi:cell wall-associated NlpC family hydrolase
MPAASQPHYLDLMGLPFERGGRGPRHFDCYGLVKEMFRRAGNEVPDFHSPGTLEEIEALISEKCRKWRRVPVGTPGALLTFRIEGFGAHVGYMLDNDRFIHAWETTGVTTDRLTGGWLTPLASYVYE